MISKTATQKALGAIGLAIVLIFGFQNCGENGFSAKSNISSVIGLLQTEPSNNQEPETLGSPLLESETLGSVDVCSRLSDEPATSFSTMRAGSFHRAYALPIVQKGGSETNFVRIINPNSAEIEVALFLWNRSGDDGVIRAKALRVPQRSSMVLDADCMTSKFGSWEGRATLEARSREPFELMNIVRTPNRTNSNISSYRYSNGLTPLPLPSVLLASKADGTTSSLRIFNPADREIPAGKLVFTAYNSAGQALFTYTHPEPLKSKASFAITSEKQQGVASFSDIPGAAAYPGFAKIEFAPHVEAYPLVAQSLLKNPSGTFESLSDGAILDQVYDSTGAKIRDGTIRYFDAVPFSTTERGVVRIVNRNTNSLNATLTLRISQDDAVAAKALIESFPVVVPGNGAIEIPVLEKDKGRPHIYMDANGAVTLERLAGEWQGHAQLKLEGASAMDAQLFFMQSEQELSTLTNMSCVQHMASEVSLPNLLYAANPVSPNEFSTVRITNFSDNILNSVAGHLIDTMGNEIGLDQNFLTSLAPHRSIAFLSNEVASKFSLVNGWKGRTRLHLSPSSVALPVTAASYFRSSNGVLTNFSCPAKSMSGKKAEYSYYYGAGEF